MTDISTGKLLLAKSPLLLKTTVSHALGFSGHSTKWTLKSELIIEVIRSLMDNRKKPWSITKQQKFSLMDPGIKGKTWVSKVVMPAPEEEDVRKVLLAAVDALKEEDATYEIPDIKPVEAEWNGYNPNATKDSPRPQLSEAEHYERLIKDTKNDTVVLFIHGGALYLLDPASHRVNCSRLAKETGGRCFNVRYRLAPQNPFPAALLDVFVAYLSLLSPPPGALHGPVPASKIVFAGDSAGGNLSFALLQLLLQIRRMATPAGTEPTVRFHGRDVPIVLPGGVAVNSPWTDLTACMPSIKTNLKHDYLPPLDPKRMMQFPPCEAWPAKPPREDLYCNGNMLLHPLVSPLAAPAELWRGSPPVWIVAGDECLYDEGAVMASRFAKQGVPLEWWHFEAQPHVFCMMLPDIREAKMCFEAWGTFVRRVTGATAAPVSTTSQEEKISPITSSGTYVKARSGKTRPVDLSTLACMSDEEVFTRMRESQQVALSVRTTATATTETTNGNSNGHVVSKANGTPTPTANGTATNGGAEQKHAAEKNVNNDAPVMSEEEQKVAVAAKL